MIEKTQYGYSVLLVGFRPFFTLAVLAGIVFPLLWAALFSGHLVIEGVTPLQWHVHEMLFGFGWAILGGFLLTSSKNWVKIRGLHGGPLAIAVVTWLVERVAFFYRASLPASLWLVLMNLSVLYIGGYVVWCLIRYHKQDFYKNDNYFFMVALPLLLVAKNLVLNDSTFQSGWIMSIAVFRLAFLVMLERTTIQFMKNAMKTEIPERKYLDLPIKGLAALSILQPLLPDKVMTVVFGLLSLLLLVRFFLWKPQIGFQNFGIGVMYVGYFGIIIHLVLECLKLQEAWLSIGAISTHTFVFLTMGIIIPSMIVRISQGHTGRKPVFKTIDKVAIWTMALGAFFRLVATQVWPDHYMNWIALAAISWGLCFAMTGLWRIPYLWRARIDGKEH